MGVATAVGLQLKSDPDLRGHLRYGLDMLATRTVPSVDIYSFTSDRPWVDHEWLTEVMVAAVYRIGGTVALAILAAGIVLAALALARWSLQCSGMDGWRLELLTTALFLIGVLPLVQTLRPQAISALPFVTLLALLREFERGSRAALFAVQTHIDAPNRGDGRGVFDERAALGPSSGNRIVSPVSDVH
jgi:hypothetical protein